MLVTACSTECTPLTVVLVSAMHQQKKQCVGMLAEPLPYVLKLDDQGMIIAFTVLLPRKSQLCWLLAHDVVLCNSI